MAEIYLITYIDDSKELVEVKPEYKLEEDKTKHKLEAMQNWADDNNIPFNIWAEKELRI